jgi:hypothetical protein
MQVFVTIERAGMMNRLEPGRSAAAQIGLFGMVRVENSDASPQDTGGAALKAAPPNFC